MLCQACARTSPPAASCDCTYDKNQFCSGAVGRNAVQGWPQFPRDTLRFQTPSLVSNSATALFCLPIPDSIAAKINFKSSKRKSAKEQQGEDGRRGGDNPLQTARGCRPGWRADLAEGQQLELFVFGCWNVFSSLNFTALSPLLLL